MADELTPESTQGNVDLTEAVKAIIGKAGEPTRAVEMLLEDNFKAREKGRTLKKELETLTAENESLKKRTYVEEGQVLLSGDDAKAWKLFSEQGGLEAFQSASKELASLKKEQHLGQVAAAMGWNAKVLTRIGGDLDYEIKSEGDKPEILVKDGDKSVPLTEYAQREWKDFAASLNLGTSGRTVIGQTPIEKGGEALTDDAIAADQDKRMILGV